MKKVLIISTSPRMSGNSAILAEEFKRGVSDAQHDVELISLSDKNIGFCQGCLTCQKTGKCFIKDDANEIVEKMIQADVICFATPVYFFEMCGQMKTMLDRSNPAFLSDYKFRDIYLLASAADEETKTFDGTVNGLQGWIDCFEKCSLKGVIKAYGVTAVGDIKNKKDILNETYIMGKSV